MTDEFEWIDDPKKNGADYNSPKYHLLRVISGHTGWVRSIVVDPGNGWFATGSADRTIKIWDLPTGHLKLTLTGHVSPVRSLAISARYPLLFSGSEDRMIKSWDLERNAVIRQYHGHLHGIYTVALHPDLDLLFSGSRDSTVKVWDIRTKQCIYTLSGHKDTINSIIANSWMPHLVSASQDSMIRLWDLRMASTFTTLTHHKKGVRALCNFVNPHSPLGGGEFCFASASSDSVKKFGYPKGTFVLNYHNINNSVEGKDYNNSHGSGKLSLVDVPCNSLAVNADGILAGGFDDGHIELWDWYSGRPMQTLLSPPQPGSLACERGILDLTFDVSGFRLLTAELDKTIKVYGPLEHDNT